MAVTSFWYGKAILNAFGGEIAGDTFACDYLSDTIKVALCTSTYTPAQDTHETMADITNEVANGNGYTTGGATLASKTLDYTAGTNVIKFDAADVTWGTSTITARYAIIYKYVDGTASNNMLLGYVDFGADMSSSNGNFTIQWDVAGILKITVS